ncbi:MAG: phosphoglycerate mutase (2,3-diphosphoglycerate-independent) [Candidatus Tagabacteria bacterium RIFCSPLOWO2_01_FULL_39_11]|uniref:2,3-bisphosphoglycerate-independent phosphoglycerate mutase n=1 Tax=Candidatus Tagabacteria bacterium RIFCSPLOWO2_01_FULL_39_11 TaxID=1802295 RepID=A0A1G2LT59_9BACT|nr:MAG: phosphoglycerate mutase (2,3-diphosphoglycerate-independent) [Candidatus Tagabacteria bacterium RIFCSPLOWO2_01_FULL_39_11]
MRKLKSPYKPVVLLVLDGFGVNPQAVESPWKEAKHPAFEEIEKFWPFTVLQASGLAVGLPWGEEGNSEVGHLTMGSGRVVYNHLPRIMVSIQDNSFFKNEAFLTAVEKVKKQNSSLHFMGLFSSGSVHSYVDHLYALLKLAESNGVKKTYLHLFTDGRDAPQDEGVKFTRQLEERLFKLYPDIKIASLVGRRYAMDRDGNWDMIEKTYEMLTEGKAEKFQVASLYLEDSYKKGIFDENIEPGILVDSAGNPEGRIQSGDAVIFFNYREDSMREIAKAFSEDDFKEFEREKLSDVLFVAITEYEKGIPMLVAFPPLDVGWPLARVLSEAGMKQLHVAETEKYAHITYFFNGGREILYPGEERILIPSLKAGHFDLAPEMSAPKITDSVISALGKYDFILANFANADMVGHTGNFESTIKAFEVLDFSVGKIIPKVLEMGGALIITGDHGNAEEKIYRFSGEKRTKHTANPVPFYLIVEDSRRKNNRSREEILKIYSNVSGVLTDIAPTILELMDLEKPKEMTGISLVGRLSDNN